MGDLLPSTAVQHRRSRCISVAWCGRRNDDTIAVAFVAVPVENETTEQAT